MIIQSLWHFRGFRPGEVLNAQRHHGKHIGIYADEAGSLGAIKKVIDQPGFRDHPDGFRLFPFELDRTYWSEGFRQHAQGDEALAGDSSGIFGNDDALTENAEDRERNFEREKLVLASKPQPDAPDEFWELTHYKISKLNSQRFEDMGFKLVGYYSTRAKLDAAIRALRAKPGFNDHPDGFRILWSKLGTVHWADGFA